MVDIVSIGYEIKTKGLEKANKEVDALLTKLDRLGNDPTYTPTPKPRGGGGSPSVEIDRTTKALEKQALVGQYLGKGFDKSTATSIASFKMLGATVDQTNSQLNQLVQNKGLVKQQQDLVAFNKAQEKAVAQQKALIAQQERQLAVTKNIAKYRSEGLTATSAGKLSTFEASGASTTTVEAYKKALIDAQGGLKQFGAVAEDTGRKVGFLNTEVGGIAKYAVLSAIIYGVMTATTRLAVATVQMADEYTAIQNRMKLYIKTSEELGEVNQKLAQFSVENNVGLRETSTLFARLAPSMQRLGKDTNDITTVVDAFGKSMRIGGATAMEAASATIQFSQAMASGKLAGDEFRSISEASPRFLKAIADGSGIAAEKLKEMSSAGMLTTEVISNALLKQYAKLSSENAKLGITLEQGTNAIKTMFTVMVGEFNEGAGITKFLGESMVSLAQSMKETSDGAKEFGESFRKTLSENQGIIELLKFGVIALSSAVVTKLAVAMTSVTARVAYGTVQNILYQATLLKMATASTVASGGVGKLALSFRALGLAMSSIPVIGWVTLLGTLVGIGATYSSMSDSAKEATRSAAEQGQEITKTKDELLKLVGVQKEIEKTKLANAFEEQNKALEEYRQNIINIVIAERARAGFNEETTKLLHQLKNGTISYSDALTKLNKMKGVSPESVKLMEEYIKKNDVASLSAQKNAEQQKLLGNNVEVAGNAMQNTKVKSDSLKTSTDNLGNSASVAGNKFKLLSEDLVKTIDTNNRVINLMNSSGLSDTSASGIVKKVQESIAQKQAQLETATTAYSKMKAEYDKMDSSDPRKSGYGDRLKQLDGFNKDIKNRLEEQQTLLEKSLIPLAKQVEYQEQQKSAISDTNKELEKQAEAIQKTRDGIIEQIESTSTLQGLLAKGTSYEVAKIASQKEYMKAFTNTNAAIDLVMSQQRAKQIEYTEGLKEQREQQTFTMSLFEKGLSLEQARNIASLKFSDAKQQQEAMESLVTNELSEQSIVLSTQLRDQDNLNSILADGLSLEEAQVEYAFSKLARLKGQNGQLDQYQATMRENILLDMKNLEVFKARGELIKANNELQRKASVITEVQSNEIANIMVQYKGVTAEQAKSLSINEKIVKKLSDYNDALRDQASLTYDLSTVNFDAFGDFGNPFESALNGLNDMIFGAQQLKVEYEEASAVLETRMAEAIMKGEDYSNLEKQRANLGLNYELEKEKAQKKAINSAFSLTKSMFKEETKGYKVITALERTYQGLQVAFALWKKKDSILQFATEIAGYAKSAIAFVSSTATKVAAQQVSNIATAQGAVANAANAPPPVGFASAAAMIALMAGLGIAISGGSGIGSSSSGYVEPANEGTGTVFGDSSAMSKSIKNSIDLLADNSDLMLPINNSMLRSLRNIESAIGGVANLLVRGEFGADIASGFGFDAKLVGVISQVHNLFANFTNGLEKVLTLGMSDKLFGGLSASILGSIAGGLFGKTSQKVTGSGLYGANQTLASILDNGFSLQSYADIKTTKKSWFGSSSKTSTQYGAVDNEIKNQFQMIFSNVYDSILTASSILGRDEESVMKKLRDTVITIGKIQTSGLSGEEIQEKLEAIIGQQSDILAKAGVDGLNDFQKIGEGYYETLVRVASGIEQADYFLDRLGYTAIKYTDIVNKQGDVSAELIRQSVLLNEHTKGINGAFYDLVNTFEGGAEELYNFINDLRDLQEQLAMTGKNADYLTASMILGAGGLDKLNSGFDAYYDMLSPAEQASELTRRLTKDFEFFNLTLPDGVKGFRDLVNSIDITTEEGQKLYGQIIALAPEFNDLQGSLESANSEVNALVQSLRDLANEAKKARGETDQNRNLEATRYAYQQNAVLAMQGDTEAAQRLLDLGKNLMSLSGQYSVTASDYARDLALIQQSATISADVQEAGLGFTNDSLTPVGSTKGTTTLATTNTSTDAKLEALREDLNAALLAIAKNTQTTASKLDAWDYGDRLLVRVEQNGTNDTIPVKEFV